MTSNTSFATDPNALVEPPPIIGPPIEFPTEQKNSSPIRIPKFAWRGLSAIVEWLFGLLSLIVGLSVLATIPVLQFLSLGYFLEASARVARSGRIRDGVIGIAKAARIGSIILGSWLCFLPARFVSSLAHSSLLINGEDSNYRTWRLGLIVLLILTVCHVAWAWFRGGRFRHFIWPAPWRLAQAIRSGRLIVDARDATIAFISSLNLRHYFSLGLRGFLGTFLWLFLPVSLLAMATQVVQPMGTLLGLIGSLLLAYVVIHLPFLQTRFGLRGEFTELFNRREIRGSFRRAPIAFFFALLMTLAFAIPLYLLKAELIPREAAWLPALVFVVFMFPSRIATGWAVSRAEKQDQERHFVSRWSSTVLAIPVTATYVGFVFLTQYVSWHGRWSLYEQHAFMLPVPFLGM